MVEQYERQAAVKVKIKEIKEGSYVVEEGWKPNYLLTKRGEKIFRVNLMGVVLDKEERETITSLVLDDGSGKISVRSFEEVKNLKEVEMGGGVLVIGKIREFNDEKYVSPEIIKKVDSCWLKIRRLELEKEKKWVEEEVKERVEEKEEEGEIFQNLPGRVKVL
jgi:RPA family protein